MGRERSAGPKEASSSKHKRRERESGEGHKSKRRREDSDSHKSSRHRDENTRPSLKDREDSEASKERERERERQREAEKAARRQAAEKDAEEEGRREKRRQKQKLQERRNEKDRKAWHHRSRTRSPERRRERHEYADTRERGSQKDREDAAKRKREREAAELDDEAEKRRKRVEAWQASKRKAEAEGPGPSRQAESVAEVEEEEDEQMQPNWTLEDEEEDDATNLPSKGDGKEGEVDPLDAFMADNKAAVAAAAPRPEQRPKLEAKSEPKAEPEEEEDPLEAFMRSQIEPAVAQQPALDQRPPDVDMKPAPDLKPSVPLAVVKTEPHTLVEESGENGVAVPPPQRRRPKKGRKKTRYETSSSEEDEEEEEDDFDDDDEAFIKNVTTGKLSKGDKLGMVDHAAMNYPPFRRNFYIEVPELARLSDAQVLELRKQLDNVKARGKDVPKPVRTWNQCGLSSRALEVLRKAEFDVPLAIQAQALPAIMSGRDCLGIAKTGSGKTLAFVLPMLRHIKDQRPIEQDDGPIALIMAPTRELVVQIGKDVNRFAKSAAIRCVCVYGGTGLGSQISELKPGCEVVVCTPGRIIDILVTSSGKVTNLRRVTYLVMDEADRMFDMGFEPQVTRISGNIRPDRQTVMFSATFPRSVEQLAKRVLQNPVEIQVGGRSVVNKDIQQSVELRPEEDRFMRLLEILGTWYTQGKVLVFVQTQDQCDNLFRDLLKVGYPCLSLHGGKDQLDRESTIKDFKTDVCNLLVATSVAARGLDVKDLKLVVNFYVPNHHEDYVHRVGRTGRAGNAGTAITFIGPDEDKFAPDLIKALRESSAPVPKDLQAMSDAFIAKCKAGTAQAHGSGYGGSGFKFDSTEDETQRAQRQAAAKQAAKEAGTVEEDDDAEDEGTITLVDEATMRKREVEAAMSMSLREAPTQGQLALPLEQQQKLKELQARVAKQALQQVPQAAAQSGEDQIRLIRTAQAIAQSIAQQHGMSGVSSVPLNPNAPWLGGEMGAHFESEMEINDFPQHARWKVTHRDSIAQLNELTGAAVTTKGFYVAPGKAPPDGERKLYLLIEGPSESCVKKAKAEIKRLLAEFTEKAMRRDNQSLV